MTRTTEEMIEDYNKLIDVLDKIHTLSNGNPNHAKPEVMLALIHDLAIEFMEERK